MEIERILFMRNMEAKKPLGLYLHIPFCVQKCQYCDFLSGKGNREEMEAYVEALLKEICAYKTDQQNNISNFFVQTIYFGGGTPSILEAEAIRRLLDTIRACFVVMPSAEITLEVNPGTVTREKIRQYKEMGINRLSIGLQSVREEELRLLGRIHTFSEFLDCFQMARQEGFTNISIDLISGLPNQTKEQFLESLSVVASLGVEHISVYSLIIEEGTPFFELYGEGGSRQNELISEDLDREFYELTKQMLAKAGYERYEFSNYAKVGYESKHNCSYWIGVDYLGLGLGASSYFCGSRFYNTRNRIEYNKNAEHLSLLRQEVQVLSEKERMEEFMFLGLRLCKGVSKQEFAHRFHCEIEEIYGTVLKRLEKIGVLICTRDTIALTDFGIDVSNQVLAEFLL